VSIDRARRLRGNASPIERKLWAILHAFRQEGYHFRRQVPIGPYYADVACHHAKLVIEADGPSHTDPEYDARRDEYMRSRGFAVLRFGNNDIVRNADGVFAAVAGYLEAVPPLTPAPVPSPQGGGGPRRRKLRTGLAELDARTDAADDANAGCSPTRAENPGQRLGP
jgi:very-short-patch-repair endonuclease